MIEPSVIDPDKDKCMNDKIKVNLQIADMNYPVWIERNQEEMVRKAAKQLNLKLNRYREQYPGVEPVLLLGMVAYHYSLETLKLEERNDTLPFAQKLNELTAELNDCLGRE